MTDMRQAGVGAFGDLVTHSLDILMWLLGDTSYGQPRSGDRPVPALRRVWGGADRIQQRDAQHAGRQLGGCRPSYRSSDQPAR
jgi:hypothetical protein